MMNRRSLHRLALGLGASTVLALAAPAWAADEAPDALIQRVSADALETLRTDKSFQTGDIAKIVALVDKVVMPHVNFRRMTSAAVGPGWR
ncbi:MAG: ABC transporter substrate-binding protein, partial [Comamonadaceae bacterium]|nr:ABC transporter substrate-binding protein [Comamonadaceae bacterium]